MTLFHRATQNHKSQQRTNNDHFQQSAANRIDSQQSFQQRKTNTLQTLNEILSKSKYQFPLPNNQDSVIRNFAEDPPPTAKQITMQANTVNTTNDNTKTADLRVNLSRLAPEHIKRMGESVSEFAKNSPETAKKYGFIRNEMDMFELMKADERNLKRKHQDDGPLCMY